MTTLLIPGRHIITSAFMDSYLEGILKNEVKVQNSKGKYLNVGKIDRIIIPITSANQHGSRYNPVPLYARVIDLERTMSQFRDKYNLHITYIPIPQIKHTDNFPSFVMKHVTSHEGVDLSPEETVVWCSTESLIEGYKDLGFSILPAEWNIESKEYNELPPNQILEQITSFVGNYRDSDAYPLLSDSTKSLWEDMPEIPEHIFRLWNDPILTDSGSLTEDRNYASYSVGMSHSALMDLKFGDIVGAVTEGKIVDEGCADGALMVRLAETFRDSDIIGLDITGEFVSRVEERQRAGEFADSFVYVYQRNILQPVFAPGSINTTICNSTLHELWSYGDQEKSVRGYLKEKFRQLALGGRLVIRDVVGPEDKEQIIYMKLNSLDGDNVPPEETDVLLKSDTRKLSTESRFFRFVHDFLNQQRTSGRRGSETILKYKLEMVDGSQYIILRLKDAVEYLSRKDYHDSWDSEMNEEFAFWDINEWKNELEKVGFKIVNEDTHEPKFSGAYVNDWIVQNRLQPCSTLYKKMDDGTLKELPYPVTNMVLVGEKRLK